MHAEFASLPLDNTTILCIGGITRSETDSLQDNGVAVDGRGFYLFLADESAPTLPVQVLAKFLSAVEADQLSRLFVRRGATFAMA